MVLLKIRQQTSEQPVCAVTVCTTARSAAQKALAALRVRTTGETGE